MLDKNHARKRKKKRGVSNKRKKGGAALRRKRIKMATEQEIASHLDLALNEIGLVEPWFDEEVDEWIFSHPLYPVEYGGDTKDEVIANYPEYLKEFLKQRLNAKLDPLVEKNTKGHGGKREGAGRPKISSEKPTRVIRLDRNMATWVINHKDEILSLMLGESELVTHGN